MNLFDLPDVCSPVNEQIEEACREARAAAALDTLARDTRHGFRRLVRDWRFTTAAVLILGLAIGANTAIFSLVNAALFRRQGFTDPDRLINIYQNDTAGRPLVVSSYSAYKEMEAYTDLFAATMAASLPNPARYLHDGAIRNASVEYTTATYLDVLGLRPSLGRWFDEREDRRGASVVAVLGYQTWTRVLRARTHPSSDASFGSKGCRRPSSASVPRITAAPSTSAWSRISGCRSPPFPR